MPSETPSPGLYPFNTVKTKRRFYFLINFFYFAILLAIAILVLRTLFVWMLPFVFAFIVASLLQRPLKFLVRKTTVSKKFFSVVLVILLVLIVAAVVAVIGWQLLIGAAAFVKDKNNISMIESTMTGVFDNVKEWITNFADILPEKTMDSAQSGIQTAVSGILNHLTSFLSNALNFLPVMLINFIIWIVASIFLTIDYQKVVSFLFRQVPERFSELFNTTRDLCTNTVFKLLKAYALLMFITFVELSIGLTILNIPYSILFAALIAVVDILPVLGTGTIVIPWAIISLIMGNIHMAVGLFVMYLIITIIRNILEPRLVSQQIGLNPLVTLFFMYLGLKALGVFGMLLFPVTIMVLKQLQESGKIKIWK